MSKGITLRLLGNALKCIAYLLGMFVPGLMKSLNRDSTNLGTWLGIVLLTALGTLLWRAGHKCNTKGKKLGTPSADDLVAKDPRPPVVYLRSFRDDPIAAEEEPQPSQGTMPGMIYPGPTEEQQLAKIMNQIGPFIAIGDPNEKIPQLGAARSYVSGTEWKDRVLAWILRARLVVLRAGTTEGFWWEAETVFENVKPERVVVLLPLTATDYHAFRKRAERFLPRPLPEYPRKKSTIGSIRGILYFQSDWTAHFLQLKGTTLLGWKPAMKLTFEPVFKQLGVSWNRPWEFYVRTVFLVLMSLGFAVFIAVVLDALLEHQLTLAH